MLQYEGAFVVTKASGFLALSHNVIAGPTDPPPSETEYRSRGVVIAVRKQYVGSWGDCERDAVGRALAATTQLISGATILIVGVCGPTGACLPGFRYNPRLLRDEQVETVFLTQEI